MSRGERGEVAWVCILKTQTIDKEAAPGRDGLPNCRECHLPAPLRDLHFLAVARRDGVELLKQHIIRELGQEGFERCGGDKRGVMDWIKAKLKYESWEQEAKKKGEAHVQTAI